MTPKSPFDSNVCLQANILRPNRSGSVVSLICVQIAFLSFYQILYFLFFRINHQIITRKYMVLYFALNCKWCQGMTWHMDLVLLVELHMAGIIIPWDLMLKKKKNINVSHSTISHFFVLTPIWIRSVFIFLNLLFDLFPQTIHTYFHWDATL